MGAALRQIDPSLYALNLGGHLVSGFADGDAITIANEADEFADYAGTDGEVTRIATNDNRRRITVRLAQSSASNDVLSAFAAAKSLFTISFFDLGGTSKFIGQAWVQRVPDRSHGREVGTREWALAAVRSTEVVGGNPQILPGP